MFGDGTLDRRTLLGAGGTVVAAGAALLVSGLMSSSSASAEQFSVKLTPDQWKAKLGAARFHILREQGTERPFTSPLLNEHRAGHFICAGCGLPLFSSRTKFESGTGWPSFFAPLPAAVSTHRDVSLGMIRSEEHCIRCGGHLGHVFDDGPPPTGKRHCINGLSLSFQPGSDA